MMMLVVTSEQGWKGRAVRAVHVPCHVEWMYVLRCSVVVESQVAMA
jgi:hypothetical protein